MKTNHLHSIRVAVLSLATGLVCMQAAHAQESLGKATVSVSNLSYRLIDLDLNDGVTPYLTVSGAMVAQYQPYGYSSYASEDQGQFFKTTGPAIFGNDAPQSFASPDGLVTGTVGAGGFSLTSNFSAEPLLSRSSGAYEYPVDNGDGTYNIIRVTNDSVNAYGGSSAFMRTGAADTTFGDMSLSISPNTLLILEGVAQSEVTLDRSAVLAAKQAGASYVYADGRASTAFNFSLVKDQPSSGVNSSDSFNTAQQAYDMTSLWDNLFYDGDGFLVAKPDGSGADYVDEALRTNTKTSPFRVSMSNLSSSDMAASLLIQGKQDFSFYMYANSSTTEVIAENVLAENLPVPVPEPGTYLLMGLGLVGICVARRGTGARES